MPFCPVTVEQVESKYTQSHIAVGLGKEKIGSFLCAWIDLDLVYLSENRI